MALCGVSGFQLLYGQAWAPVRGLLLARGALHRRVQSRRVAGTFFNLEKSSGVASTKVDLRVLPKVSLTDEAVRIFVSGLAPNQIVTVRASLVDEKGFLYSSRAFYQGDAAGEVDLEKAAASGGDYRGVLPMGLLWALSSEKPFHRLMKRDVIGSPFRITVDVFDSFQLKPSPSIRPLASQTIERWYVAPGVRRIAIREGRVRGALFLPPGDGPFPGVIDMFGGVGGLTEFRSGLLASRGFATLALAYFAYDDLPGSLTEVDLEYFEEAADLLLKHPKVLGPTVGVVAVCKGAEIALAMATFLKQVAATVCINGTNSINGMTLHYRDLCINGSPYKPEFIRTTNYGAMEIYDVFVDPRAPEHQNCLLPVERALGSLMFVVGGDDRNYNSKLYADEVLARLKRNGKTNGRLLFYPGAGHLIEPPGSPLCRIAIAPIFPLPLLWGGELTAHCKAQEHSWREIQNFLLSHLKGPVVSQL
ncbi:bile acid-CoA:amino acid N-acyltransferase-like [Lissotriton helveticus]